MFVYVFKKGTFQVCSLFRHPHHHIGILLFILRFMPMWRGEWNEFLYRKKNGLNGCSRVLVSTSLTVWWWWCWWDEGVG